MQIIVNGKKFVIEEKYNNYPNSIYEISYLGEKFLRKYETTHGREDEIIERINKYLYNFKSRDELKAILNLEEDLPEQIIKSLKNSIENKNTTELLEAFMFDYEYHKKSVLETFSLASEILGKDYNEIIKLTDYSYKDCRLYRLSDAIAELRVVIALNNFGFSDIELLKQLKKEKQADIIAIYKGRKIVADVAHGKSDELLRFNSIDSIIAYLNSIYNKKCCQLDDTIKKYKADYKVLACIIDEINEITALNTEDEIRKIAQGLYKKLNFYGECGLFLQLNGDCYNSLDD